MAAAIADGAGVAAHVRRYRDGHRAYVAEPCPTLLRQPISRRRSIEP